MARLLGIAIKERRKGPILERPSAYVSVEAGIVGDWRGKPGSRQVTLMSQQDWLQACDELGVILPWTTRRSNLLVDALPLYQTIGQHITIGGVVLEICGETDPCSRMEEAQSGLFEALKRYWRGGVNCRVLTGGDIAVGDEVVLHKDTII